MAEIFALIRSRAQALSRHAGGAFSTPGGWRACNVWRRSIGDAAYPISDGHWLRMLPDLPPIGMSSLGRFCPSDSRRA